MTKLGVTYGQPLPYKKRDIVPAPPTICEGCGEVKNVPCINERADASDLDPHRFCSETTGGEFLKKISSEVC